MENTGEAPKQSNANYFENILKDYRSNNVLKVIKPFTDLIGIDPLDAKVNKNNFSKLATTPDQMMDWAIRLNNLEKKLSSGVDSLDPIDAQGVRFCLEHFSYHVIYEWALADDPNTTPDMLSKMRGGGVDFVDWIKGKVDQIKPENKEEQVAALELVSNPLDGVVKAGKLAISIIGKHGIRALRPQTVVSDGN